RVKELKKGIKCSTSVTNRRWIAGSASPKRIQNSPSLPPGEKNSPKKVKLGLQHPSAAAKTKPCPSALQPPSVPFTSTPRGVNKGHGCRANPSSPWFHHTSPVKGVLRMGQPLKKKADDLPPQSASPHVTKDFIIKNAAMTETKESGQREKNMQDKPSGQSLKVQTVQPVQKQLVSREDFSYGDGNQPSDGSQEWGNGFAKQCVETWTNLSPFQKEREEHLRLYHQQFQQPPIFQQKLNYQPFERCLTEYKPQEIQVQQELSFTPTEAQSKEGMQLEDLDDSDFSEDSFSPVCSQKSVKRSPSESSQHSFFLHQREQETEEEEKDQKRKDLLFKYSFSMQEHELDDSWDCSRGCPKTKESIKNTSGCKTPSDWSYDLAIESSPSNTAEKPYCLQDDLACNWKNGKDFPGDLKQYKPKHKCLIYSSETPLTPEKEAPNPCVSPISKSGTPEYREINLLHRQKEEPTLDRQASLVGDMKWRTRKNGVSQCGSSSTCSELTSEAAAPLAMSLLDHEEATDTETVSSNYEKSPHEKQVMEGNIPGAQKGPGEEAWQCTRNRALTDSMLELGEQTRRAGRGGILQGFPQAGDKWFSPTGCRVKPCCCLLASRASNQGVLHSLFVGIEALTEASAAESRDSTGERESGFLLRNSACRGYADRRQCDADVRDITDNLGRSNPNQGHGVESMAQEIHANISEKGYFSGTPCFPSGENTVQSPSQEGRQLLQPRSGLSHSEDIAKSWFRSEEIGLLKNKWMQSIFTKETLTDSESAAKEIKPPAHANSPSGLPSSISPSAASEMGKQQREALEKAQQAVIRAHRQQLDEMAALCLKEECLINQVSATDFQNFVTKLDEILVLKSKCIQTMRAQLKLCSAAGTDAALQAPPPV
ncbi:KIF24 protein, partial [Crypturellus undulatus]|nr:KIF24 protein [Crypturellus undulatus]